MRSALSLVLVLAFLAGGCTGPANTGATIHSGAAAARPAQLDTSTTQVSEQELYRVSFTVDEEPLSINKLHTWKLHIETMDGQPVDGAAVSVEGGMPEHNHGLPTQPQVTAGSDGDYFVEGMKFQMPGWWTVTVVVNAAGQEDRATFNLVLK
jgi:hypothetical protein